MAGKVQVARRERLHRLCKSIISDPRSVDAGTVAEFKSTALRYAQAHTHTHYDDPERVFKNLYHDEGELGDLVRGAFDVVVSKQLDNEEISPLTGAANPRNRSGVIDNEEKDDLMTDNINKAHRNRGAGPHGLTGALLEHLHDRLEQRREQHGYQKREEGPLDQHQELISIMKECGGPVALCKGIIDRGRSPCDEAQLVAVLTKHAGGDRGFAKLYESEPDVQRACSIAKAAEFSVFDIQPVVITGPDAMNEANDDDDSAVLRATKEIQRIGRERFPFLRADQQFARVFEDKNYAALAAQAHQRPGPKTVYAMPRAAAYAKSDPAPNTDTAYAALMAKAEAYRDAHSDLSIAQCFEKVYTDRANVELAKRERVESAPR